MSFGTRLTLLAATAVAVAIAAASVAVYFYVRDNLVDQVDATLVENALAAPQPFRRPDAVFRRFPRARLGGAAGYRQIVWADGRTALPPDATTAIPVSERTLEVAAGSEEPYFADARVAGTHVRIFTAPLGAGVALQVMRPLDEVDRVLHDLRLLLLAIGLAGVGGAAILGALVARGALVPVRRLTETAEHVTRTRDLRRRIDARRRDELGRLAGSFNEMLAALEESVEAQRRLVGDASHELRTPLTSLRANADALAASRGLEPGERETVADIAEQVDEMAVLVGELVELARGEEPDAEREAVALDELVATAVERARRHRPEVAFATELEPTAVDGVPRRLDRAVANLLDNAAKWSPPGATVEVRVAGGEVAVRDHGPGIADEDVPYVFDRFYRAADARSLPGSGLGLAIVRQVAEAHGGSVRVERPEGGGTRMVLRLPAGETLAPLSDAS